jgi:hypothetical protein
LFKCHFIYVSFTTRCNCSGKGRHFVIETKVLKDEEKGNAMGVARRRGRRRRIGKRDGGRGWRRGAKPGGGRKGRKKWGGG